MLRLELTGFKPDALNSASNRLTDECLVPLLSARMLKSGHSEYGIREPRYVFVAGYRLTTTMTDEAVYLADGQGFGR